MCLNHPTNAARIRRKLRYPVEPRSGLQHHPHYFNGFLMAFALSGGCSSESVATTYDDCIFQTANRAQSELAVKAIVSACVHKFPQTYDWEAIAVKAGVKPWSKVKETEEFVSLTAVDKRAAKEQYWTDVIRQHVRVEFLEQARAQFLQYEP